MSRTARLVLPGYLHHVTQRGNRKEQVFFDDEDRIFFLSMLRTYSQRAYLQIVTYCLMINHIHLLVVPEYLDSLWKTFKLLHMVYSQYLNRKYSRIGINWQGRFFSSPMDNNYSNYAFPYVCLNPVVAKVVDRPEDYQWSSARAHIEGTPDTLITADKKWLDMAARAMKGYRDPDFEEQSKVVATLIRENTLRNLPIGSSEFIEELEQKTGRVLKARSRGGQRLPEKNQ